MRLYDGVWMVSNTLAALVTASTVALINGAGTWLVATASALPQTNYPISSLPIGAGEVWRITNNSANAGRVFGTYIDVAATTYTLVRMNLTAALQTVIAAPAAGSYSRWAQYLALPGTGARAISPTIRTVNVDSVGHSIEQHMGGFCVGRSSAMAAGAQGLWPVPTSLSVTAGSGPLQAKTTEALGAGPGPTVVGAYETLPT